MEVSALANLTNWTDETRFALANLAERAFGFAAPSIRLGVTGLSRAGKTVFITALVHNLLHGGRLPLFKAYSSGRISNAELQPQPDDNVPRFDYEAHVAALVDQRIWPESTRRVSELRLTVAYESATFMGRTFGGGKVHLDIVDYPGEWLLDLPLLTKDFATWSAEAIARAERPSHRKFAATWLGWLGGVDPLAAEDEMVARELAALFTEYLRANRAAGASLSTEPPGRFLLPGDLDGSPALTFSPLRLRPGANAPQRSLVRMMERRYEAYKSVVVKPFFREHFARLDRQIVLVDALAALNAGPDGIRELQTALGEILASFRPGRSSWLNRLLARRIDRILVAATKADHLHHEDHDRLEAILRHMLAGPIAHAEEVGARVDIIALASVRATREGTVMRGGQRLPSIIGKPLRGEVVNGETFDGNTDIALFPGDLPDKPDAVWEGVAGSDPAGADPGLRYVRFRPPPLERTAEGLLLSLPHIRLDRALDFLLGDRLA